MTDPGTAETIFALASAPGRAGVAVVRISGPAAGPALDALAGSRPVPRRMTRAALRDPATDEWLDDALMVLFPEPASYTGEDVAELHIHGGRAVLDAILQTLSAIDGLRSADPGEFSRRAFLNDKLDLSAAEGVMDLVEAETAAQRRQALRQSRGELGRLYDGWRSRLVSALARLEAWIDFPDEDLPADMVAEVSAELSRLQMEMIAHLAESGRGERLREGLRMAIVGPPNTGKSSLLNWLAKRDVAIVSATAGTTRDVLEVYLDVNGYPATVADTAGLRESGDSIEREGVRRALLRAESADLRLVMVDAACLGDQLASVSRWLGADALPIANKAEGGIVVPEPWIPVSIRDQTGLDHLFSRIAEEMRDRMGMSEAPMATRTRHREAVEGALEGVGRAILGLGDALPLELAAEDLRIAGRSLGRITGSVDVEELLDLIFGEFCLGK